jgi:hypothetical protein
MAKTLIVNADDYGRTPSISAGIRQAHLNGVVTTTTVMMNFAAAVDDIRLAMAECPRLGLGVHLTITAGKPLLPVAQVPTLVDRDGVFLKLERLTSILPSVNPDELRAEWRAQIEKFLSTGATLDHLDSHHHTSYLNEEVFRLMLDIAFEYKVPIRSPYPVPTPTIAPRSSVLFVARVLQAKPVSSPRFFVNSFYDSGATSINLLQILSRLLDGVSEIMTHPGYVDDEILSNSSYNRQREAELAILTSDEVKKAIAANGITLATFADAFPTNRR